jgi:hypothetical protein
VVAHIDLQNIVVGDQVAGEDAQVIQAAKQTVDQDDGELLCGFCADCARLFNFMAKFFFRSVGLGYYVGHSAIRLQDPELSEFYRHPGLTLSAVGICPYNPNDLYSE